MSESLGAAYVSVSLDSAEMEAKVERAKGKLAGLGADAQSAFNGANVSGKAATLSFAKYGETIGLSQLQVKRFYAELRGAPKNALDAIQKKAEATQRSLEAAAVAANKQANSAQFVKSLRDQSDAIGKTRADLLELKAAELGVAEASAPFIAKLREQEVALKKVSNAKNAYGLSDKQSIAAMRQVPAQMTDIFVSLQGGQKPLTVLIQQGGQLKDVFGGVVPAVKALGGELLKLATNPFVLLAAGAAALAYTLTNAANEQSAFTRAILISGNAAGTTSAKLSNMAAQLTAIQGVSTSSASDAIVKVVSTGRFVGEQINTVTRAALEMSVATGKSIDETIASFVKMKSDPVGAILELNEAENFLTQTVYDQIVALVKQGDTAGASDLALRTYSERVSEVTSNIRTNVGYLDQLKNAVKTIWSDIVDGVEGIGRATTNADLVKQQLRNIQALEAAREKMRSGSIFTGGVYGKMSEEAYARQILAAKAKIKELTQFDNVVGTPKDTVVSQDARELESIRLGNALAEDRQKLEEKRIITLKHLANASKAVIDNDPDIVASRAAYARSVTKPKTPKSTATADLRADLQAFKDAMAAEQADIANGTRLVQAQYSARLVDAKTYYTKMRELAQRSAASEESGIANQIAELKARNATGTEAINISRQIASLESKLGQVRAKLGVDTTLLEIAENQLNESREFAKKAYRDALVAETSAMERSYQAQYAKVTMSDREYEKSMKLVDIEQRLADKRRDLANQLARDGGATNAEAQQQFEENTKLAIDAARKQKDGVATYYTQMATLESNWRNGMTTGLQNWKDRAADVAGQVASLTTSLLNSTVNTLTTFANTGKFAFKEMLADMLRQMAAFMMNQAVLNFLKAFAGDGKGGDGKQGFWGSLISAAIGGLSENAKGATYKSQSLSGYSNGVYNSPQPFMFAKGAGVFGEAGWEAIMPLTRGPDGNLGVRTTGGGGAAASGGVSVNIVLNSDGSSTKQTQGAEQSDLRKLGGEIGTIVEERLQRHMMPGGLLWKAGVGVGA